MFSCFVENALSISIILNCYCSNVCFSNLFFFTLSKQRLLMAWNNLKKLPRNEQKKTKAKNLKILRFKIFLFFLRFLLIFHEFMKSQKTRSLWTLLLTFLSWYREARSQWMKKKTSNSLERIIFLMKYLAANICSTINWCSNIHDLWVNNCWRHGN